MNGDRTTGRGHARRARVASGLTAMALVGAAAVATGPWAGAQDEGSSTTATTAETVTSTTAAPTSTTVETTTTAAPTTTTAPPPVTTAAPAPRPTTTVRRTTTTSTAPVEDEPVAEAETTTSTTVAVTGTSRVVTAVPVQSDASSTTTVASEEAGDDDGIAYDTKINLIVGALVGLALLVAVLTVLYWRHTRPGAGEAIELDEDAGESTDADGGDDAGAEAATAADERRGEGSSTGEDAPASGRPTDQAPVVASSSIVPPLAGLAAATAVVPASAPDAGPTEAGPTGSAPSVPLLDQGPLPIVTLEDLAARAEPASPPTSDPGSGSGVVASDEPGASSAGGGGPTADRTGTGAPQGTVGADG